MIILTLRTDSPQAEIGLFMNLKKIEVDSWAADRSLAETLHNHIVALLTKHDYALHDIEGVVVFRGPGSFTGLRIGISVANGLALGLNVPIVGSEGDIWQAEGLQSILDGTNDSVVVPFYGADVRITLPKK